MEEEIKALETNNTWSITTLPLGKHTVGCRWTYKTNHNSDGYVNKHKARLIAKGYTQQQGVNFSETFSPVAKIVTVKLLLALAASQN